MHLLLTQDPARSPYFGLAANDFVYQWLDGLLRARFEAAGWTVTLVAPAAAGGDFDPDALALALDLAADPHGWARLFDQSPRSASARDAAITAQLGTHPPDLIVGFELPPWLIGWAQRHAIPFASLAPAAWRFLPELPVELHTDIVPLRQAAGSRAIDPDALTDAAAMFAALRRARQRLPLFTAGPIGVLLGQMTIDAASVAGGRLVALDERIEAVARIADGLDLLLVRPHPYEMDLAPLRRVVGAIGNARLTTLPTYDLLCTPAVRDVMALSSSALQEATLFGKHVHALLDNDRSVQRRALSLTGVVLDLADVLHLLGGLARATDLAAPHFAPPSATRPVQHAPLRDALGLRWGLDDVALPALLQPGTCLHGAAPPPTPDDPSLPTASRVAGWWEPDGAFCWSRETTARLLLRANGGAGHCLDVTLFAPPHAMGPVDATLGCGPVRVSATIPPGTQRVLGLEIEPAWLIGGTLLEVEVTVDRLTPPVPGAADHRDLGVGLDRIVLR